MSSDRQINRLKSQANRLPNKPGVYVMSNEHDKVIYVGKAKGLKNRVKSYFTPKPANEKVQAILKEIQTIETTITITEREDVRRVLFIVMETGQQSVELVCHPQIEQG